VGVNDSCTHRQCTDVVTRRRRREEADDERLLGPDVTGRASRRQRHDDVYSDRRQTARRRAPPSSRHCRQLDDHQYTEHRGVVIGRRQRRRQGRVRDAWTLPCALSRRQRNRHATATHTRSPTCLSLSLSLSASVCLCLSVCLSLCANMLLGFFFLCLRFSSIEASLFFRRLGTWTSLHYNRSLKPGAHYPFERPVRTGSAH